MLSQSKDIFQKPLVSVIILNWNGYQDTLECLQSLAKCTYDNFEVILVDNASEDDSVELIKSAITDDTNFTNTKKYFFKDEQKNYSGLHEEISLQIIENPKNFGFARGNNIGMEAALKNKADYIMLLNNDTVADKNCFEHLLEFFKKHADFSVATPQIRYFDKPEIIWNCGGKLTGFGSRKYFFDDKHFSALPAKDFFSISFITGCALFIKAELIEKIGMLSEDFFFGEEDYEFSMRLKKNKVKAACVLSSIIFHKVNSSISKTSDKAIGKIYIHYLNRFIDLRKFMPHFKWQLWRHTYLVYIFLLMKMRHKIQVKTIYRFTKSLLKNSKNMNGVDKQTFDTYINNDFSQ